MENNYEKELKELIKKSEDIEVPQKISIGVDEVLESLKSNNSKRKLIRRISAAAVIIFAALAGFVATCPTLASEIPIINKLAGINSLFNKAKSSEYSDEYKNLSKLNNVSLEINKGVYDKGVTITIKEIAYDEAAFYVIYEVSLDKNLIGKGYLNRGWIGKTEIDGKKYETNPIVPLYSDDTKLELTAVLPVVGRVTIPDKFDFNMSFTDNDLKGSWNFKIPLAKENLQHKVDIFRLNKIIRDGWSSVKLLKLTSSPVYITLLAEFGKYEPDKYDYVIMDSKGTEYEQNDAGGIVKNIFSTDVTFFYNQIENSKVESISILKPKIERYSPNKLKSVQYVPLNSKVPIDVTVGNNKKITVNSISEKDNKIEIIFSAEGFPAYSFGFIGGISIYDKNMNKENKEAYDIVRPKVLGDNKYKISIPIKRKIAKGTEVVEYDRDINKSVICIGNYDEIYEEVGRVNLKK